MSVFPSPVSMVMTLHHQFQAFTLVSADPAQRGGWHAGSSSAPSAAAFQGQHATCALHPQREASPVGVSRARRSTAADRHRTAAGERLHHGSFERALYHERPRAQPAAHMRSDGRLEYAEFNKDFKQAFLARSKQQRQVWAYHACCNDGRVVLCQLVQVLKLL